MVKQENKNEWVDAPLATVHTPQEIEQIQTFQKRSISHARHHQAELAERAHPNRLKKIMAVATLAIVGAGVLAGYARHARGGSLSPEQTKVYNIDPKLADNASKPATADNGQVSYPSSGSGR